jgi:drug/metabolite transporter (DMT)-like permease
MLFLALSICCTVAIYLLFRVFGKYGVDMLPAIVINYFTCAVLGNLLAEKPLLQYAQTIPASQLYFAIIIGIVFVTIFYVLGKTTNLIGVAGSTIVSRMSMVIPTTISVIWLGEELHVLKIIGIVTALAAIYFTVAPEKRTSETVSVKRPDILFPILSFFGVGATDSLLKISQERYLGEKPDITFVGLIYNAAFAAALVAYILSRKPWKLLTRWKNLLGGFVLGLFNFYGIVLIYKALAESGLGGSTLFPINSVGTVALSTIAAIFLFGEKMNGKKALGLALAVAAIVLIAWWDFQAAS